MADSTDYLDITSRLPRLPVGGNQAGLSRVTCLGVSRNDVQRRSTVASAAASSISDDVM